MNLQDIKQKLSKNFLKYGFLPYVYLLEELQEEEQYELCAVVLQVVQEKNIKFDLQLRFATWHQLRIMKTDFHIYNKKNLKIIINKIQQLCQIAVKHSIYYDTNNNFNRIIYLSFFGRLHTFINCLDA